MVKLNNIYIITSSIIAALLVAMISINENTPNSSRAQT